MDDSRLQLDHEDAAEALYAALDAEAEDEAGKDGWTGAGEL
jgi:hypothetical protein